MTSAPQDTSRLPSLLVVAGGPRTTASSRHRLWNYRDLLERDAQELRWVEYSGGSGVHVLRDRVAALRCLSGALYHGSRSDVILVQKLLLPTPLLRHWKARGRRLVYDFDDALYARAPTGESAAVAQFQVTAGAPDDPKSLEPLFARQRELLDLPRVERDFDKEFEERYFKLLAERAKTPAEVALARRWLLGTLPVHVFNPPNALETRAREDDALRAKKRRWNTGIMSSVFGGSTSL